MRGKNLKVAVMLVVSLVLLSSCNLFPAPESLIKAPKQVKGMNQGQDLFSIAQRNLPKGSKLTVPEGPVGMDPVISIDLDGDTKDEALVFYQSTNIDNQVGAFVLKKDAKGWGKIFIIKGSGSKIHWANAADVMGDRKKELLLGWQSEGSAESMLEIFYWKNDKLTKLKELMYNEIEAVRFEDADKTRLAVWKRDMADAYSIDLLTWKGNSVVADKDYYPSYYQAVIAYYQLRIAEVPDAAYYWYYLADAHLKANLPEQAIHAIDKGLSLNSVVPTKGYFQTFRMQAEKMMPKVNFVTNITPKYINKYSNLEDELMLKKVKEAASQYRYVMSGGDLPEGKIETVMVNRKEYRYLGKDLDTKAKVVNYLTSSFTTSAIDSFLKKKTIFEFFNKLIQPNADGGSLLNYDLAEVVQKKDKGNEMETDLKVPLGDTNSYEFVHISFQKTENGWRIFSEPGTF
ncbi:DL-endopeptidase inhibitor IseA family protein [Neobacillus sp. CF12]|uniref:DL-endopeptidase inhibitor IseA family protein n=1 Tax=Neobacillus sp. CF12 TaxID=3055864 RepID=UPI0025A31031|nr:DL-endopeptidase inhibitor IseA family protein [Neobacillus sp. CF12]MDM5327273.1 DL-endopeptidase inhibitor IseA family protein [Neobacillus sp. CF12]